MIDFFNREAKRVKTIGELIQCTFGRKVSVLDPEKGEMRTIDLDKNRLTDRSCEESSEERQTAIF